MKFGWLGLAVSMMLLALLSAACGEAGSDGSGEDAPVAAPPTVEADLETLVALGALGDDLGSGLDDLAAAEQAPDAMKVSIEFLRVASGAATIADGASRTPDGRLAKEAATQTRDAAEDLARIAREIARAYSEEAMERPPSSEAQDEVVELAGRVSALRRRLDAPERTLGRASKAARSALASLTPLLGSDRTAEVASLKVAFSPATLEGRLDSLRAELDRRSAKLSDEVAALEPPDVVVDCTSAYETVSSMSVRNMDCAEADALIIQAIPILAPTFSVAGFSCSILGDYGPVGGPILGASDVRCEAGDQAFRFGFAD